MDKMEYQSEEDRIYYKGYHDGYDDSIQRALGIVNYNWDAMKSEANFGPSKTRDNVVELIARIIMDLQTA